MKPTNMMLLALLSLMPLSAASAEEAPGFGKRNVRADDQRAIAALLQHYTHAVSHGDEAEFAQLLLNENIPFFATYQRESRLAGQQPLDVSQYARFREAVFRSHRKLTQRFVNVRIEQDGDLATVSLDFLTREAGTRRGSYGWKTLQLIKDAGTWKIASEFYSAYEAKEADISAASSDPRRSIE